MERRFEIRKREILREADLQPGVSDSMLKRLDQFAQPFIASLRRREVKDNARLYLGGLLSALERDNVETNAHRHVRRKCGQPRSGGEASWEVGPLQPALVWQVGTEQGEADGVLVEEHTAFAKCGAESVGVQRQWP